jgi:hypothetical protein
VTDFVESIYDHRQARFTPSEVICVDESISRCGQRGQWIGHGLQHYISIDRNPEKGCEIQNFACERSDITMRIHLVTTSEDEMSRTVPSEAGLLHGTVVLQCLISSWEGSNMIICVDSYFASVEAPTHLRYLGLLRCRNTRE